MYNHIVALNSRLLSGGHLLASFAVKGLKETYCSHSSQLNERKFRKDNMNLLRSFIHYIEIYSHSLYKPWINLSVLWLNLCMFLFAGRGVFATAEFSRGNLLLQYPGEIISAHDGEMREKHGPPSVFRYCFHHDGLSYWWVDIYIYLSGQ